MKTVKVLTVDLDTTEAKVKLDDIEAQLDRILDKQKQLGIFGKSVFIGSSGEELHFNSGIDVRKVVEELETYRKKREKGIGL